MVASYLYQLSKNIHWPNAGNIKKYHFHIIDTNKKVYQSLKDISRKVKLRDKSVEVTFSESIEVPDGVHVVYLGNKKVDLFDKLVDKMENQKTLLVSNAQENKRLIMINLFETSENQLRFEINKANILNQSLGIEPDIILLGGTEIDVAKLFRESQVTLKEQEQNIRQQKKVVAKERARIAELSIKAQEQQRIIIQQEEAVLEQKVRLEKAIEKTKAQEHAIQDQKIRLETAKKSYAKLAQESEEQQRAVLEQQEKLEEVVEKTKAQELVIDEHKSRVEEAKKRYANLSKESKEQQKLIEQQQKEVLEQQVRLEKATEKTKAQEQVIADQKARVEEAKKRYAELAIESEEQQILIEKQQRAVLKEAARFEKLSGKVREQQNLIKQQDKAVLEEKEKLKKAIATTLVQDKIIVEQKRQVAEEQKRYTKLAKESIEQQAVLERQKAQAEDERIKYERLTASVQQRELALKEQAKKINARSAILKEQDEKIAKQEKTLALQSETISSQQNFLYALGAVVFLLFGLAYTIYRGYRIKKIDNAQLSEQKILLQNSSSELAKVNERLKGLDRLKSMFIASMSHELRTPLNSIIGFNGILLSESTGKLEPQQKDFLGRAYKSAKHLLLLINDVIDISKIESGRVDAYIETFAIDTVVNQVVDSARGINKKNLGMNASVPEGIVVSSDQQRLFQCVLNLVSNALKYTQEGEVNISVSDLGDLVEILVEDTGIGVSEADLKKLFLPFERLDSPLRISETGTGLGLYLTQKLATTVLEGSLKVESQLGVGSKFYLHIPKKLIQKEADPLNLNPEEP